ncbi:MAG: CAP domain-containing protein, partial [Rubrobacter sp.]
IWRRDEYCEIIMLVLTRTERLHGRSGLRYRWVAVALAAVVISIVVAGGSGSAATSYDTEELQFLRLINDYRQANGVGSLILSDTLAVAAEHHSEDMGEYGFFAHNTVDSSYYPAGAEPWDRMAAEGYRYNTTKGENLATGTETAEEAFKAWRESPSHNAAMLDGRYRVIGIARVNTPGGTHSWYWTTDFGGVLDPTSHAPGQSPQGQAPDEAQEQSPQADPETQKPREVKEPRKDGGLIENGAMNGEAVWEQKAKDGAALILDNRRARLGGYDDGVDELRQKVRVGRDARMAYNIKIETSEDGAGDDVLLVRITDDEGNKLAVLRRYTDSDEGRWQRENVDLSRFEGETVKVGFRVRTDPNLLTTFYLDEVVLKRR